MLAELRVENLLLIERAELRLSPGLNVLTGETGAGKTVLAHALDLLLGGRSRSGIVRPGAEEAYVEGIFEIPSTLGGGIGEDLAELLGAEDDEREVVLARRVRADGRTRALINGRTAAVADLRALGGALLRFYAQQEHRSLTLAGAQLAILDSRCGAEQAARLRACAEAHGRVRELRRSLERLEATKVERDRELDLLEFEIAEIEELAPDPEEHARMVASRERLRALDSLLAGAGAAAGRLLGEDVATVGRSAGVEGVPGAAQLVAEAGAALMPLEGVDPRLDALAERLRSLALDTQELAHELAGYCEHIAGEGREQPAGAHMSSLEELEEGLAAVERLVRKHGGSIESVHAHDEAARLRRGELAAERVSAGELEQQLEAAGKDLQRHAGALRRARRAASGPFAKAVAEQLSTLAMPHAGFEVVLGGCEAGPGGADTVEFLIAPNPGVPGGPVREIASGGELSRVMLAILSVARGHESGITLVFDEVDAGIGGHTAKAVGARLRELSRECQVICITHLPQIASLADRHFSIVKEAGASATQTRVRELADEEVVEELARMLGAEGEEDGARRHAEALMRAA
ncbi:MAG TPA: DNA repair protein RecN [Solirubrobacteraceae bacterium]|nr:DNA repair protein RecN [Solirubrobacteraceae bacterium]